MIFHILKNDLKRKKTMNIILFLFIILAAIFVASGINNVVTVMNGIDYYLDQAGVGDYVIVTMGDNSVGSLNEMLETEEAVSDYRLETAVYGAEGDVTTPDGKKLKCRNVTIYESIDDSAIYFFDKENNKISSIEKGHVYVSGDFMEENNLHEGDVLCLEHSGTKLEFVLDGMAKDALFGSDFMGNTRYLLNDEDMQTLLANEEIYAHYRGEICYIDTKDVSAMSSAMSAVSNVAFNAPRSTIKMAYVMEMIVAFVMLILSVCLIVVSFVVLKFSITFTIAEEFREIGVMKAIGLSNAKIRSLSIVPHKFSTYT